MLDEIIETEFKAWLLFSFGIYVSDLNLLLSGLAILGNILYIGLKIYKTLKK